MKTELNMLQKKQQKHKTIPHTHIQMKTHNKIKYTKKVYNTPNGEEKNRTVIPSTFRFMVSWF